ncbi:MAG TPA: hypothetical protein VIG08_09560 [Gemmatimonadales bacterium]|jgi:hypothetical protein
MHPAVELHATQDVTDVPSIVRGAIKLGLIESVAVLLFSLASRFLPKGPVETVVLAIILFAGLAAVALLPGLWTRARSIEGIAGSAGMSLAAAVVFLLIDAAVLQNIGTYTNRWYEIGGGSGWWYHPVWWMAGTFISWMGAWLLANGTARAGQPSAPVAFGTAIGCTIIAAIIGVVLGVPGAGWNLATFGVAFLPGIALATALSSLGSRRG